MMIFGLNSYNAAYVFNTHSEEPLRMHIYIYGMVYIIIHSLQIKKQINKYNND